MNWNIQNEVVRLYLDKLIKNDSTILDINKFNDIFL